jgi:Skp family chaperone for outer membrane proteins
MKLASFFLAAAISLQAGPKVATIDIRKALTSTSDGKAAVAELERRFGPAQRSLSDVELRIRILHAADEGNQPALRRRIQALERSRRFGQELVAHQFEEAQQGVLKDLNAKLIQTVEKYAKRKHFEVVLDLSDSKTPVLWTAPKVDITGDIIKIYDSRKR